MRLYDEIFKSVDGISQSRCVFVPNGGGYFEGVKSVSDFSEEETILCFAKFSIVVAGRGLTIKKYCDGDLQLSGEIQALRVENNATSNERLNWREVGEKNSPISQNSLISQNSPISQNSLISQNSQSEKFPPIGSLEGGEEEGDRQRGIKRHHYEKKTDVKGEA